MTGVELFIRDKDYFYCYKQRHDGYYITDFVKKIGNTIFTMTAEEIIHKFHDDNFLEDSWGNYHTEGKPLEYGIKIPSSEIKSDNFDDIYEEICKFIWDNYNDEDDEDNDYSCGYGDYIVYIDLINKDIQGIDDEEDEDEDDNRQINYGGYFNINNTYKHVDNFDNFKKSKKESNGKPAINSFIFHFSLDEDEKVGIIPFLSEPEYEYSDRSDMDDKIIDVCDEHDLESIYGVHDVSYGETLIVNGQEYESIFGFSTYEVKEEKIEELMNIWKNSLNDLGFETDDVIITDNFDE